MGELLVAGDWLVVGRGGLLLLQACIISVQIEQIVTIRSPNFYMCWFGWGGVVTVVIITGKTWLGEIATWRRHNDNDWRRDGERGRAGSTKSEK